MKMTKPSGLLFIIMTVITLGFFLSYQPLFAQENPEDLQICNGQEGQVEDPASQACVIRDCDCNRIANNGRVGELICMEKRTVRNDDGQVQYACKFPNSPTGASCNTIGFICPGAGSDSASPADGSTPAQTQDPSQSAIFCEEKLLQWAADKACDSQYNRYVSLDRWQSSAVDPATGLCREFFLPNHVLEDEKCGSSAGLCDRAPVNLDCQTKICLSDGAEACQETWKDEDCNVITKVGRLTGATCKSDTTRIDIDSTIKAVQGGIFDSEKKELTLGIDIIMGFRDRSTTHGSFRLHFEKDPSDATGRNIDDIAAVWLDNTRFTLNPNNYHTNNFDLSRLDTDLLVHILTTQVSDQTYEAHPQVTIEFADRYTRIGKLDIKIEPNWVGTTGPKRLVEMMQTLEKITIINPYTGEYFTVDSGQIREYAKTVLPGEIPNEEVAYSIIVPVRFRDGTELESSATLSLKQNTSSQAKIENIWDITGVEISSQNGQIGNLTFNPANIQPNNITLPFDKEEEVKRIIQQVLALEVPTQHTEIPIAALVKFQDGTTRDAQLLLVFEPGQVGLNPPRTITDALSNIQSVTLYDPVSFNQYYFPANQIIDGNGQIIEVYVPEQKVSVSMALTSVNGTYRSQEVTFVYRPGDNAGGPDLAQGDKLQKSCVWKECDSNSGSMVCIDSWTDQYGEGYTKRRPTGESCNAPVTDNAQPVSQAPLVDAVRVCLVRGDTGTNCTDSNPNPFDRISCTEPEAIKGNLIHIGFQFLNAEQRTYEKYYRLETADVNIPELDPFKTFMGLLAWDQSVSLYRDKQVKLPQDVKTIPITIQDQRYNPVKEYRINANEVNYVPRGCGR